jgi:hypothetical protein
MTPSNRKQPNTNLFSRKEVEQIIISERLHLYNRMQPCGPAALRQHLHSLELVSVPSVSTIGRILAQNHLTHGRTGFYPEDYQ